jgi:hypothetical protein
MDDGQEMDYGQEVATEKVPEVVLSPQDLAREKHAAEEARRAAQKDFDPKVHGVGTHPAMGPQSVTELHNLHMTLEARVEALERRINRR